MSAPVKIPADHLSVCKMGQGRECCRYLVMGEGFSCAKRTSLKATIDFHVASMTAQGDNCPGLDAV